METFIYITRQRAGSPYFPFGDEDAIYPFGLLAHQRAGSKDNGLPQRSVSLFRMALWDGTKALIKPERRQGSKDTDGD